MVCIMEAIVSEVGLQMKSPISNLLYKSTYHHYIAHPDTTYMRLDTDARNVELYDWTILVI